VAQLGHVGDGDEPSRKDFVGIAERAEADLRELLAVPANYKVLFLQGGATAQFAAIPLNLGAPDSVADYVNTGAWSKKAISEAKRYCKVNVAADAAATTHRACARHLEAHAGAAYVHYTPNETIGGVEFRSFRTSATCRWWRTFPRRSVAPIDVSRFG